MTRNEHLMHRLRGVNRQKFFELLDNRVASAKAYDCSAENLYQQARHQFIQLCTAHERETPPEHIVDCSKRKYYKAYLKYQGDELLIKHTRKWLEAFSTWRQYLHELVGVLQDIGQLEKHLWIVFETYQKAQEPADDEKCENRLDELREELALAQTRQKWSLAGCNEWKGQLLVMMGRSSVTVPSPSALHVEGRRDDEVAV